MNTELEEKKPIKKKWIALAIAVGSAVISYFAGENHLISEILELIKNLEL